MQFRRDFSIKISFLLIITLISFRNGFSQTELSSDSLFVLAREEAYQKNNYPGAINLLKLALNKSPNYTDLRIFLGRIYTFSDKIDSARNEFQYILNTDPKNEDAINGLYDLEYWNDNYKQAQKMAELGINYYPDSASYYIKKAKVLKALEKDEDAILFLDNVSIKIKNDSLVSDYLILLKKDRANQIQSKSNLSSDELFIAAKKEAYDNSNYPSAIELIKKALLQSPNYSDLRIFLGRLYTFTDKRDSAKHEFQTILNTNPKNQDAINGIYDLEYWNENYIQAQSIAELGINYYPDSAIYYIKKARALNSLLKPYEAIAFLEKNLNSISKDSLASQYLTDLKNNNLRNRIGGTYEYVDFDERFDQPWHFGTIGYGFRSVFGRINARLYYANRFDSQGLQGEIEAYPSLKGIGYQYIGFAVSDSPIFPRFRAGYSLFASLPKSFEGEIGFRYLRFTDNTFLFTGAIGRYSGNNFYNIRTFVSPGETAWSYSFTASARFFMSDDMDDFFNISAGTGVSPDDRIRLLFINSFANLKSYKAAISFNKVIKKKHLFSIDAGWVNEEYNTDAWGNQYSVGVGYSRRF